MARGAILFVMALTTLSCPAALACGWWGDAEAVASREAEAALATIDPAFAALAGIPGGGYGVAVVDAVTAVPYRAATGGREAGSVAELVELGFRWIVDMTPSAKAAAVHRLKSGGRIGYLHFGSEHAVPDLAAVHEFAAWVGNPERWPLIMSGPEPRTLGILWALHLMAKGMPAGKAFESARAVGLDRSGEADLWWHLRNGRLKNSGLMSVNE